MTADRLVAYRVENDLSEKATSPGDDVFGACSEFAHRPHQEDRACVARRQQHIRIGGFELLYSPLSDASSICT